MKHVLVVAILIVLGGCAAQMTQPGKAPGTSDSSMDYLEPEAGRDIRYPPVLSTVMAGSAPAALPPVAIVPGRPIYRQGSVFYLYWDKRWFWCDGTLVGPWNELPKSQWPPKTSEK